MKETSRSPHTGRSLLPPRQESKTITLFWLGGGSRPLAWQKRPHLATAHAWMARRPSAGQDRDDPSLISPIFHRGCASTNAAILAQTARIAPDYPDFMRGLRAIVPGLTHDSTSDSTSQKRLYQRAQKCALQAQRAGRAGPKLTQQEKPFSSPVEDNFRIDVSCGDSRPVARSVGLRGLRVSCPRRSPPWRTRGR